VSQDYDDAINTELADIQCIHKEKSKQAGEYILFTEIHVRKRIPIPFPKPLNWADFISACGVSDLAAANVCFSDSQGVIEGGFAIQVGEITFYGIRDSQGIGALCLIQTRRPCLTREQAQHISGYLSKPGAGLDSLAKRQSPSRKRYPEGLGLGSIRPRCLAVVILTFIP